jgi:hypothetical protein
MNATHTVKNINIKEAVHQIIFLCTRCFDTCAYLFLNISPIRRWVVYKLKASSVEVIPHVLTKLSSVEENVPNSKDKTQHTKQSSQLII